MMVMLGLSKSVKRMINAPTLEEQKRVWDGHPLVHFVKQGPRMLVAIFCKIVSLLLFNRAVLW